MERIAARAARLPRHALVALVAEACAASDKMRRAFDAATAMHDPLPEETAAVLESPDLLMPIMARLDMWDGKAACVCRGWKQAWEATVEQRPFRPGRGMSAVEVLARAIRAAQQYYE